MPGNTDPTAFVCAGLAWLAVCGLIGHLVGDGVGKPLVGTILGIVGGPVGWCAVLLMAMAHDSRAAPWRRDGDVAAIERGLGRRDDLTGQVRAAGEESEFRAWRERQGGLDREGGTDHDSPR